VSFEPGAPTDYLVGHVEEALACDPRVNEQGLHVNVVGKRVFVTGTVSTKGRRDALESVVGEVLPGYEVRNEVTVSTDYPEPAASEMERLP
jgi:osmotically-inducible protein OsmY